MRSIQWLVAAALAVALCPQPTQAAQGEAAPGCGDRRPVRTIYYPERDSEIGWDVVHWYANRLAALGVLGRHCLVVKHSTADLEGYGLREAIAALRGKEPAAILAGNGIVAKTALEELPGVPVFFQMRSDPVRYGLAESYARPAGMATGVTSYVELVRKDAEILKMAFPSIRTIGVIADPAFQRAGFDAEQIAAEVRQEMGMTLSFGFLRDWEGLQQWLNTDANRQIEAWIVLTGQLPTRHGPQLIELLEGGGRPAIYSTANMVRAGGLMAYEAGVRSISEAWARMVDAVFSGTPIGEVPIERANVFELTINADAAARMKLPARVLKRATAVVRTSQ